MTEQWLSRLEAESPEDLDRLRQALVTIRLRGYDVGLETPSRAKIGELLSRVAHANGRREWIPTLIGLLRSLAHEPHQIEGTIDPDEQYPVNYVMAPVLDAHDDVQIQLAVMGFDGMVSGHEIEKVARTVTEAAALASVAERRRS